MSSLDYGKGGMAEDSGRGGDRTHNPRLRRPVLYPIELLARVLPIVIELRVVH